MISPRGCSKSSAYLNGRTQYYCTTHNHDMHEHEYQCKHGELENHLINQLLPTINTLNHRVTEMERHFNDRLKEFAANLEKLHEPDPDKPG